VPDGVVAIAVHDPSPTRELAVLHRRSVGRSPAIAAIVEVLAAASRP